jgi:hypothetical protein
MSPFPPSWFRYRDPFPPYLEAFPPDMRENKGVSNGGNRDSLIELFAMTDVPHSRMPRNLSGKSALSGKTLDYRIFL